METIKNYLENMFANFPSTSDVLRMKAELLANMEDKYNELKAAGKSENEAIGVVISEFGNIDELMKEMGYNNAQQQEEAPIFPILNKEETTRFLSQSRKNNFLIALGVFLCIMAPAVLTLICGIADVVVFKRDDITKIVTSTDVADTLSLVPFFIMIGIAVGLFVYAGVKGDKYKFIEKGEFAISGVIRSEILSKREAFQPLYIASIVISVMLFVLCPLPAILSDFFTETDKSGSIAVFILLTMVATGVFILILSCGKQDDLNKLLHDGEFSHEKKKESKLVSIVASIYWPLMAAIYLVWSFVTEDWHISWLIWPVSGILFGIFSTVVSEFNKN